jgi:transposase
MIGPPPGTRVWLACGVTDMRAGMDRLATLVQQSLGANPFDGAVYLFVSGRAVTLCPLGAEACHLARIAEGEDDVGRGRRPKGCFYN